MENSAPPVDASRVSKSYGRGDDAIKALDDFSFVARPGEVTVFVGPSGCGKTTMLRLIAGLEYPTSGRLRTFGRPITAPGPDRGMIFQAYTSFPWLTVQGNVEYGMKLLGVPKEERQERAAEFLKLVRLDDFATAYPKNLSGGMKQRVAIARTLAQNPKVLLMDEPFGALDAQVRWEMQEMMIRLIEHEQKTVITVTHDINEAIYLGDRILFFTRRPGRLKADLSVEFKQGQRFLQKEEMIGHPDYAAFEASLYSMMREEIEAPEAARSA